MKVSDPNFVQIPNDFSKSATCLDASEFRIFIFLASKCYNDKDVCWPTQETIAENTNMSIRTVKSKLKSMIEKKVIKDTGHAINHVKNVDSRQKSYVLSSYEEVKEISANLAPIPKCKSCTQIGAKIAPTLVQNLPTKNKNSNNNKLKNTNSPQEVVSDKLEPEPPEALEQGGEATDTTKALSQKNRRMLEDTIINWFSVNYPSKFHVPAAFRAAKFPEEMLDSFWRFKDSWRNWRPAENTDRSLTILKSNIDRFVKEMETEQAKWDAQNLQSKMDDEDRKESIRILDILGVWTNRYLSVDDPEDWNVKKAVNRILNATVEVPGWLKAWAKVQGRIEGRKNKIYFEDRPFNLELVELITRDNILNTMSELGLWSDEDFVEEV